MKIELTFKTIHNYSQKYVLCRCPFTYAIPTKIIPENNKILLYGLYALTFRTDDMIWI